MDTVQIPIPRDLPGPGEVAKHVGRHRHWARHHWERHMGQHFKRGGLLVAGAFIGTPVFLGYLNDVYADHKNKEDPWLMNLQMPSWTPPQPLFKPIWRACYTTMGVASFLVWRHGGGFCGQAKLPLLLYGGHLALNLSWIPICYKTKSLKAASVTSVGALVLSIATTASFHSVLPAAAYIMIPYVGWLTFETVLTIAMSNLNSEKNRE